MASTSLLSLMLLIVCSSTVLIGAGGRRLSFTASSHVLAPCFDTILAFGDSTTDTGNAIRTSNPAFQVANNLPYGMTFFDRPTGRFSDGRFMVDFLSEALNLSFVPAHLEKRQQDQSNSSLSDNFAVAGATAMQPSLLQQLANATSLTPDSLATEVQWFQDDLQQATGIARNLDKTVVYFGEIGGNDYNYAFLSQPTNPQVVLSLIPTVMESIENALEAIVKAGVKHVIVQGEFPMGCMPVYLKMMGVVNDSKTYDSYGCVAAVTAVSNEHNTKLKEVVNKTHQKHPEAQIVFLDTTAAYLHVLDNAQQYGFTNVHDACLDLGQLLTNPTNIAQQQPTTTKLSPCQNPQNYVSWDGLHMTDSMYKTMMALFLDTSSGFSSSPSFLSTSCKVGQIY